MPIKKEYQIFGLLLLSLWATYNTGSRTSFAVCAIISLVWSLYLYATNTQPHTPVKLKDTKHKALLVVKIISLVALVFGAFASNYLYITSKTTMSWLVFGIVSALAILFTIIGSDMRSIKIAPAIAKFAIIASIIMWACSLYSPEFSGNYKIWMYPLAALTGWIYDRYFYSLNWTNYILSALAVASVAALFMKIVFTIWPNSGFYMYFLLVLSAYGLIVFSNKMFRTKLTFNQNVQQILYDTSIKFKDETNRQRMLKAMRTAMKILVGMIVFVLFAWWLSTIDFHKNKSVNIAANIDSVKMTTRQSRRA